MWLWSSRSNSGRLLLQIKLRVVVLFYSFNPSFHGCSMVPKRFLLYGVWATGLLCLQVLFGTSALGKSKWTCGLTRFQSGPNAGFGFLRASCGAGVLDCLTRCCVMG